MSGGSVRDRIKAAEQASASDNGPNARNLQRRGTKLSLNTDEHIKEEFLRRGDGGWHKRVDIGQHQKFVAPPLVPPVIKLTAETPLVTTPTQQLPGKINLPRGLEMAENASKGKATDKAKPSTSAPVEEEWQRVARLEAEQQEAIDLAEGKTRHEEWDRVAAMEARQQAEMDAAAALAEAEKEEAEEKAKKATKGKPTMKRNKEWDNVAAKEAKQQAAIDADAILADLSKDAETKRKADIEAEAMLAEFEREEAARKKVPGAFDDEPEPTTKKSAPPTTPKPEKKAKGGSKKDIPIGRYSDLLDEDVIIDEGPSNSRSLPHEKKSRAAHVEDEEELHFTKPKLSPREKILFDPVEYQKKKQARQERRASRQQVASEEMIEERPRSRTGATRSPSILLFHVNDDDDHGSHSHRKKHRSRSRSNHDHEEYRSHDSPDSHRRSSSSLWPSFSNSERRSVGNFLDPSARPRSSHGRTSSDDFSMASARSEVSVKKLEAVEYIAGKRLDHIPLSPPKSPSRPAGFVRSRSHTGEYSEGFTHEKKLLRRPSDEDEIVEHVDHDWDRQRRRSSRHSHSKSKDEPWQLKILHEIVRR